ncbi:sensor domain-containing diguanylate cyclase [Ramlibacter humi]|uniref:Diguanylate cyclase n=1 Tax=Ramlibacter humi TaxID=2530451 RepID=A0A4Z0BUT8_9BURK|nr:7TM diverse intracellular signaling domain-containing protein [Ramlibacter humi]TFZ02038.1 diguanylate cyclase [Ramlibacter humi]
MQALSPSWRRWLALACWLLLLPAASAAEAPRISQWVDASGGATIEEVAGNAARFEPMEHPRPITLGNGALWLRVETPELPADEHWYLMLTGAAFIDHATLFSSVGGWREQFAGDHRPVSQWSHPNFAPLFELPPGGGTVWLRIENKPAPVSTHLRLLSASELQDTRDWTYLLVGAYLGFGVLVAVLAIMYGRLSADVSFHSYTAYVLGMLLFQLAFTGVGAVFFWPHWALLADAAPSMFVLLMTAAGIWNIRNATALPRHGRFADRAVMGYAFLGLALVPIYLGLNNAATYVALNLYALGSVVLSISVCLWTWRRGESYSLWLFFGFLPVHLAYPFPALRAAGVLPDSWATQYAVLIGSAIEIPLLLYVLHRRARDFSENRARLRALESTDPLTGLVLAPVLRLRLRDALRRGRRLAHRSAVMMVELSNHQQIAQAEGRDAADRALVVAASRLSALVRDVDTVCRVSDTRFAVLLEGPCEEELRKRMAQHMVARGLERVHTLPPDLNLRFRIVTASVPDGDLETALDGGIDELQVLRRMDQALDQLADDPRRVIAHREQRAAAAAAEAT